MRVCLAEGTGSRLALSETQMTGFLASWPVLLGQIHQVQQIIILKPEPVHEISNNVLCGTSKASDQPAHMRSLIIAFASRLTIL